VKVVREAKEKATGAASRATRVDLLALIGQLERNQENCKRWEDKGKLARQAGRPAFERLPVCYELDSHPPGTRLCLCSEEAQLPVVQRTCFPLASKCKATI
jgi:hypothetical protein